MDPPKVSQLTPTHIRKLKDFLDPEKNYCKLGNALFVGDEVSLAHIESLELRYSGGGSPAMAFIRKLAMKRPTYTVGDFINLAKDNGRIDISSYLKSLNCSDTKFHLLEEKHKDKVAHFLDLLDANNWVLFAEKLGFDNTEIDQCKQSLKEPRNYSPTEGLIKFIMAKCPSMELSTIKEAASNIGRQDVADYLDSIIEELELV